MHKSTMHEQLKRSLNTTLNASFGVITDICVNIRFKIIDQNNPLVKRFRLAQLVEFYKNDHAIIT